MSRNYGGGEWGGGEWGVSGMGRTTLQTGGICSHSVWLEDKGAGGGVGMGVVGVLLRPYNKRP